MVYFLSTAALDGNSFDLLLFLAASALKATFLLGFVGLLCLALRRFPAATRHMLWTLALCAALLLPFLSLVEVWEVPILPAQISSWSPAQSGELARTTDDAFQSPSEGVQQSREVSPEIIESKAGIFHSQPALNSLEKTLPVTKPSDIYASPQQRSALLLSELVDWALTIWLIGALLLLFKLLVGFMSTNLLTRGAVEFKDPKLTGLFSSLLTELQLKGRVRFLRSERTLMPIVCGVFRAVVLLPASADAWSEERSRMVLLHELTHVTRKDCLTQMLAQTACAFYWFNPFVWHAARRLRVEREQACDDYVLSIGTKPSDYAHHLLEIARHLQEHSAFQWSQTTTVAMARRSQLEGRLLAILSKEGQRSAMSQIMTVGITALIFLFFLVLAVIRPTISSAHQPQLSVTASGEETKAAGKSAFGSLSATVSELKDKSLIRGVKPIELNGAKGSDINLTDNSREKIATGSQGNRDLLQNSETITARNAESDVAETTPPQIGNFPMPGINQPSPPPSLFVKAVYQQERKPEAQDNSVDFIDEMASVGYLNLSIKELVSLKATGVTADYIRGLRALGLTNLTPKELSGMSANGLAPAFIEAIRNAGYKELSAKELLSFRIQGVTPEFINRLRKAGYDNLTARQLIEFAIQQVTPEFISSMRAAGFGNLSPKELVTLRVHGVTPEFIRAARKRLGDLTLQQIITLKNEGLIDESSNE